ncbi:hypothetical protein VF21_02640 [Pseudogymnoascus sp. 05NY08]|nr:hypothetical protein VF21_02640 [Pseudogymnoascus sp. 05NY08]
MPPKKGISQGSLGSRTGLRSQTGANPPQPGADTGGSPPFDPNNPYAPGAVAPAHFYGPGIQRATPTPSLSTPSQIEPRPGEDAGSFERRKKAREQMTAMQAARRARARAVTEAADAARGEEEEPKRKMPRWELVARLNEGETRVTRSAIERDEELGNCHHCSSGRTWPLKCHGGDECIECEARGIACIRANRRHFDTYRSRQLQGIEPWRPDVDQCRQCKNIPMSTYGTGLPPAPQRTNVRYDIDMRYWPPPSGRLDIPINGAMPGPDGGHQAINSGQGHPGVAGPAAGPAAGPYVSPYAPAPGPAPGPAAGPAVAIFAPPVAGPPSEPSPGPFAGPSPGPAAGPTSDPFAGPNSDPFAGPFSSPPAGPFQSPPVAAGPSSQPLGQNPGFNPRNFRTSLYNPFDDDKPPCSHCRVDPQNRNCDQNTACWECFRRGIIEPEDCRTSRPCELCFMNELPCDAGSPCANCMFLGFGADECRPEGLGPQKYFPNGEDPEESDDEPYIHIPVRPEFDYSCAFCVAYGFEGCDPRDRPCLPCIQHGRTALQCRFEERCARCIELDVPCDGKMPCSLCATADGLTSMMCLGRGDTTMPGGIVNEPPEEGEDIPMGEGGDFPVLAGFGYELPPRDANDPFAQPGAPPQEYVDPGALVAQGPQGQLILPQDAVPLVPPGGLFYPPPHVRETLLPHYRIRTDVYANGQFDPQPGGHVSWHPWNDGFRCKETLATGQLCNVLPTMNCDGGEEHGDEEWCVCAECRRRADESLAYLMEEIEERKNLFCCATCSQAQMIKFNNGTGFENMETLVDNHCDCDAQMRAWLCYACKYKVIHAVGNRMISTREKLTRDADNAILCPRCGVEPGNKEAAYQLANGVARCSSCWFWINYAK